MKPIEGYDLINEAGEFRRLPAGIYPIVITNVVDVPEKEYLEIYCDIFQGEYKDYFKIAVENGGKDTSKTVRSYKQNALAFFKGFMTAIEKSNPGYKWDWDETKLVGKKAVGIFGEEEYEKDGQIKISTKLIEVRSVEAFKAGKLTVPPLKKLEKPVAAEDVHPEIVTGGNVPSIDDDEFPF